MSFQIEKVAELSRLNLKPEEMKKLQGELDSILQYVKTLETLDTKQVEPTSHVLNLQNVYRPDEARLSDVRDEVLSHAPQHEGKFFKVPKVVDRE